MMLSVVIKGPSFEAAYQQISSELQFDCIVELRLDLFSSLHFVGQLREAFSIPMIFTLKVTTLEEIHHLASFNPEYFDIPSVFIETVREFYPQIKTILSYHNFEQTPDNLESLYQEMKKTQADFYKIAVMAKSTLDALKLLVWAKPHASKLVAISMGTFGEVSRILAPVLGFPFTYAALDEKNKTAPGQLTIKILKDHYNYFKLTTQTPLYGLIGNPVDKSVSDLTHNQLNLDLVYVKMALTAMELPLFFHYAKQLGFAGLSVTMPLKEAVLPFLDEKLTEIEAVNTIHFKNGKILGYNTDGIGALEAIEKKLKVVGKQIVIIGAGGSAQAIAHEALKRGAKVLIINRNKERAVQAAARLSCEGEGLDGVTPCDIIINCTPHEMPIDPLCFEANVLVMDIKSRPKVTAFIKHAQEKGCRIVFGYEMFVEQACKQFEIWFGEGLALQISVKLSN